MAGGTVRCVWLILVVALGATGAELHAQIRLPQWRGYVNDFANVIPAEAEARITQVVDEVRAKSGGEIAVVTLPSLEGRTRHEVALQILREWGVGAAGKPGDPVRNAGTVLLVVPKETSPDGRGHVEISLGYTTNAFITAAQAGRIRDDAMIPYFRQGDYGSGILSGVVAIARQYGDHYGFEVTGQAPARPRQRNRNDGIGLGEILFFLFLLFVVFGRFGGGGRGGRRRRGFGGPVFLPFPIGHRGGFGGFGGGFGGFGGGGGGGFGGFGGGSGGGGGAGGSW